MVEHESTPSIDELLLHAASACDMKLARAALDKGAHLDCQDFHGNTPLMRAATYGDVEMLKLLIEMGANINAANEHGVTALMKAAIHDRAKAAQVLLDYGADGGLQDSDGFTAKDIAIRLGNGEVAAVLQFMLSE